MIGKWELRDSENMLLDSGENKIEVIGKLHVLTFDAPIQCNEGDDFRVFYGWEE